MEKLNLIGLALLLLIVGGVARTAYFDNRTDALAALNTNVILEKGKCNVLKVTETILAGEQSGEIIAQIQMGFFRPNWDRRLDYVVLSGLDQATIEKETKQPCKDLWAAIQAEPQFQKVDSVVVNYHKGILADILEREFDLDKGEWQNK